MPPPPLHTVQLTLPASLRALSHVEQLVSDFLIPSTIDAAMYLELNGVLSRYSDVLEVTFGAMDGAATRGKLTICEQLYTNRTEGCSPAAFTGAAANGHLDVLQWLYSHYPEFERTIEQIISAAGNGHDKVVEFLEPNFRYRERAEAMEAAAANGRVNVIAVLLPRVCYTEKAYIAAANNGQVGAIQFMLQKHRIKSLDVKFALEAAVQSENLDVIETVVGLCDSTELTRALACASQEGSLNVVERMVNAVEFDMSAYAFALERAGEYDRCAVVEYFLGLFPRFDVSPEDCSSKSHENKPLVVAFLNVLLDAAKSGRINLVKILLDWSDSEAPHAFDQAVLSNQWELAKMVLSSYVLKNRLHRLGVEAAASEYVAAEGDVEMAELVVNRVDAFEASSALKVAVGSGHLEIVKIFIDYSDSSSKLDALVCAALHKRVGMIEYLLDYCDQYTISEAFKTVASPDSLAVSKLLLKRCNPGTYTGIFKHASENNLVHMVRLLLVDANVCDINRGIITAATKGNTEVVDLLVDKCDTLTSTYALEAAAMLGQMDVVRLLRDQCDLESIRSATERARAVGCDEVVQLLGSKRKRLM